MSKDFSKQVKEPEENEQTSFYGFNAFIPLVRRAYLFCEDGDFEKANEYADKALDIQPESVDVYIIKFLVDYKLKTIDQIVDSKKLIENNENYERALRFSTNEQKEKLLEYKKEQIYNLARRCIEESDNNDSSMLQQKIEKIEQVLPVLERIKGYKDIDDKIEKLKALKDEKNKLKQKKNKHKKIFIVIFIVALLIFAVTLSPLIKIIKREIYLRNGEYGKIVEMDNLTEFVIPKGTIEIKDNAFV